MLLHFACCALLAIQVLGVTPPPIDDGNGSAKRPRPTDDAPPTLPPVVQADQAPGGITWEEFFQGSSENYEDLKNLWIELRDLTMCCLGRQPPTIEENPAYYDVGTGTNGLVYSTAQLQALIVQERNNCPHSHCVASGSNRRKRSYLTVIPPRFPDKVVHLVRHPDTFRDPDSVAAIQAVTDYISSHTCITFTYYNSTTEVPAGKQYVSLENEVVSDNNFCLLKWESVSAPGATSPANKLATINLHARVCFDQGHREVYKQFLQLLGVFPALNTAGVETHITVVPENIDPAYVPSFSPHPLDATILDTSSPFDYGTMLLPEKLGRFTQATFRPAYHAVLPEWERTLNSAVKPSFLEIKKINDNMCADTCNAASPKPDCTPGGGYNSPHNCSLCICPGGLSGADCTAADPHYSTPITYGGVSQLDSCSPTTTPPAATEEVQFITSPNYNPVSQVGYFGNAGTKCQWLLKATNSSCKVEAWFDKAFDVPCVGQGAPSCVHYVEVKNQPKADWTKTGRRFCCKEEQNLFSEYQRLFSDVDEMLVLFNAELESIRDPMGFKLYYKQLCGEPTLPPGATTTPAPGATEICTNANPYSECASMPGSENRIQSRINFCIQTDANGNQVCSYTQDTRNCRQCDDRQLTPGTCAHELIFGTCFSYEVEPTYGSGWCTDPKYGLHGYETRERLTTACPAA